MAQIKADPNKVSWEESVSKHTLVHLEFAPSAERNCCHANAGYNLFFFHSTLQEFPILCETCLGDNPYLRMTKQSQAKECKVCTRPFTVFRWCPGVGMRFKKTEICQTCSKVKNVCQTCLLDLEFGLPVQVRDSALGLEDNAPRSDVNKEYFAQNMDAHFQDSENGLGSGGFGKAESAGREMLKKLQRKEPYYKRNRQHICSFFVKGNCTRGAECPYRHEMPQEGELANQNIKDRYYGTNDPVARKMLSGPRAGGASRQFAPPEDKSVTSLFITGVTEEITEPDVRGFFYVFGEIKSVVVVHKSKCAFVNFTTRAAAELAFEKAGGGINLQGQPLRVSWARSRPVGARSEQKGGEAEPTPGAVMSALQSGPPPPPGSASSIAYPSQDPTYQGSTSKHR
ncbi:RNA binding motif protein 22 [Mortierella alpina]|nr:RNA binding motif protein 22 [Mortierella alpina]